MLFAVVYLLLRRLVGLAGGSAEDRHSDIEILVLRHQLAVLRLKGTETSDRQCDQHVRRIGPPFPRRSDPFSAR
jgi:hypothetical protein